MPFARQITATYLIYYITTSVTLVSFVTVQGSKEKEIKHYKFAIFIHLN
jgi:hypothetical protein